MVYARFLLKFTKESFSGQFKTIEKHSENMAKNETMCDHGATVRLYATQIWAKFASYGLAVQWLMNE